LRREHEKQVRGDLSFEENEEGQSKNPEEQKKEAPRLEGSNSEGKVIKETWILNRGSDLSTKPPDYE